MWLYPNAGFVGGYWLHASGNSFLGRELAGIVARLIFTVKRLVQHDLLREFFGKHPTRHEGGSILFRV